MLGEIRVQNDVLGELDRGALRSKGVPLSREHERVLRELGKRFAAHLTIPIITGGMLRGVCAVHYVKNRRFSPQDKELAALVAQQVGLALENAQLRLRVGEAAAAAERERLARELHDAVSQTLFSAGLLADVLPELWERDRADALSALNDIRSYNGNALREMRQLLLELRPGQLVQADLQELIQSLVDSAAAKSTTAFTGSIASLGVLSPEVKLSIYRTAQEALANVTKYARATVACVDLSATEHGWLLEIEDNGVGFDPAGVGPMHHGVRIMQERAASIHGQFTVVSAPGAGTKIRLEWTDPRK
ncbi:MAG: GAF domain-containing protein [Dehalococcoidia bacterium]|nr:GAF domain-containing protein [Dehalococcoidia bacterium]